MVKFDFDLRGYVFQSGIDVLRQSFVSAREALSRDIQHAENAVIDYETALARGGPWIGECDDDGAIIWDRSQILEMDVEITKDAAMALRKAFAISIYHHWERSALIWTNRRSEQHDDLTSLVSAQGIPVDPKLGAVRDLVNLLKHSNDRWGQALQISWSSMFSPRFRPTQTRVDWYDVIQITDQHVDEIFEIVAASGPAARTSEPFDLVPDAPPSP